MTTTWPGAIDSFDTHVDSVDDVMAADVNDLGDAIIEIEKALGTEGQQGLCGAIASASMMALPGGTH